jgi:hypothetical protein
MSALPSLTQVNDSRAPRTVEELSAERARLMQSVGWIGGALLLLGYIGFLALCVSAPFQDMPNHLARGVILDDLLLHHGARFGSDFQLSLTPIPYVLHDLLLAGCIELFGVRGGANVFMLLALLSLPAALLFYAHSVRLPRAAWPYILLVSLFLGSDWFFVMGFVGFRLAIACILVSLGLREILQRRWSRGVFVLYVLAALLGYLIHLAAPAFLLVILATSALLRAWNARASVRGELRFLLPIALLLAVHFLVLTPPHSASNPTTYDYFWGAWSGKFKALGFEFHRYGGRSALVMELLLVALLVWPVRRRLRWQWLSQPRVLTALAVALVFLGGYFALPAQYSDSAFVDVRALPIVTLMLLLAVLNLADPQLAGRQFSEAPLLLAALLALGNLAYLVKHVSRIDRQLTEYREVGAELPRGARVLPIHTRRRDGDLRPLLHAGSFLVIDRDARIPYLFSGDRGDAMKYFRYRHHPYMPDEEWYRTQVTWNRGVEQTYEVEGRAYTWRFVWSKEDGEWETADLTPVDWNRVACGYDFLVPTLPVDVHMIGVPARLLRRNSAAALFSIDHSSCQPERLAQRRRVRLWSERW